MTSTNDRLAESLKMAAKMASAKAARPRHAFTHETASAARQAALAKRGKAATTLPIRLTKECVEMARLAWPNRNERVAKMSQILLDAAAKTAKSLGIFVS